jgi:hypothetical protein
MELIKPKTVSNRTDPYSVHAGEYNPDSEWEDHSERVHEVRPSPSAAASSAVPPAPLVTASQMLGTPLRKNDSATTDSFREGMIVQHPTHGLGKIVSISGLGGKRMATVQFVNATRPAKFFLAHSQLQLVSSDS